MVDVRPILVLCPLVELEAIRTCPVGNLGLSLESDRLDPAHLPFGGTTRTRFQYTTPSRRVENRMRAGGHCAESCLTIKARLQMS